MTSPPSRAWTPLAWWFEPVPLARIAVLRTLAYLFIPVDVLVNSSWIQAHAYLPTDRYRPLLIGRLLPLPVPTTAVVHGVETALLLAAVLAAVPAVVSRYPRLLGAVVFGLYLEWMVIAMSYGKVDHDRFAFLVCLAVLPTVGAARWRDRAASEAAGWAVRAVTVAVVATYFLSAWAKVRFGGWEWVNSAVLSVAILRRGTTLGHLLLAHPTILLLAQWGIVAFELLSWVALFFRRTRLRVAAVLFFLGFHLATYAMVTIIFLPHVICLAAFLPLERLADLRRPGVRGYSAEPAGSSAGGASSARSARSSS